MKTKDLVVGERYRLVGDPDKIKDDTVVRVAAFHKSRSDLCVVELPLDARRYDGRPFKGWRARFGGVDEFDYRAVPWLDPDAPTCWWILRSCLQPLSDQPPARAPDIRDWPHVCPWCGGPAYLGFTSMTCRAGCR